jgi:hypothetical protein
MDFKPKVWKQGNETVEYAVKTCGNDKNEIVENENVKLGL